MIRLTTNLVFIIAFIRLADGHGRLVEPPSRSSMWRFGFNNPPNYNDHQLFCGGSQVQWEQNGGKCGVCGDNFNGPRENEAPTGKYAKKGIIVKKYDVGAEMLIRVHITVNHKGWFEFRLCQNDVLKKNVTHDCFDKHVLQDKKGVSRFVIPAESSRYYEYTVRLPQGLRCRNCILQWKYNTGNSWGKDINGIGCVGCGPQEQFYGCSDIAIGYDDVITEEASTTNVVVPKGDVDERTEWKSATADTCNCVCNSSADNLKHPFVCTYYIWAFLAMLRSL